MRPREVRLQKGPRGLGLKGQSNEIFDLQFNSPFEPAWATDQWVKIFSIFVWFSLRYSNFSIEKTDSPGYHTPGSQNKI